jgi:hypothetical protein
VGQKVQLANPDCLLSFEENGSRNLLIKVAKSYRGHCNGDSLRFDRCFWEVIPSPAWSFLQSAPQRTAEYEGRHHVLFWEQGRGQLVDTAEELRAVLKNVHKRGIEAWGRHGVVVKQMGKLPTCIYTGEIFDGSCATVIPHDQKHLLAVWTFCSSSEFNDSVRQLNQKMNVENGFFVKVPFDLAHWQKVAAEKYPRGLPKPFSNDPTQWLFNGHPKDSDRPLHVAVARLLGYQWPRQTGCSFPDCPTLRSDGLEKLADDDGIVCLSATKGEAPAAERLRELLARAWGKEWNATVLEDLLAQEGHAGKTIDDWFRNGFFEQHCALFHQRPFICHIWDGQKSGFSALVNYHKLTHANLEKLTYAYLGDWIRRQQAAVDVGEAGSDGRLQAAKQLQSRLKLILEGEPPYDIFVRWKPLSRQAIGWHPDINDGVRLNLRPFAMADVLRKRVKIKWDKDRGKEPERDKKEFPWFWGWNEEKQDFTGVGKEPDGNRWNDCHYTNEFKRKARKS